MVNLMIIVFASLLTLTGLALIYSRWQGNFARKVLPLWAGWSLVGIAVVPWTLATGIEAGIVLSLMVPTLFAWLLVAGNSEVRARKLTRTGNSNSNGAGSDDHLGVNLRHLPPWQRNGTLLLLTVPLAALSATFTSVAFTNLLPFSELNRMALSIFLMPVVWGALAFWQCADPRWQRPALVMLAAAGVSAVLLFL